MRISKRWLNPKVVTAVIGATALIGCGVFHWRVVSNAGSKISQLQDERSALQLEPKAVAHHNDLLDTPAASDTHLDHGSADHVQAVISRLEHLGVVDRSVTTQQPWDGTFARAIPTQVTFRASLPAVFELLGWLRAQDQVIGLEQLKINAADDSVGAPMVSMRLVAWVRIPEQSP